jgi:hypothetical protein
VLHGLKPYSVSRSDPALFPGSSVALCCLGVVLSWGSNASLAPNLGSLVGPMIGSR